MTKEKWLTEAKRYAKHAFCYEGMVEEFPTWFDTAYEAEEGPYDAVDDFGMSYGLDRADGFYGINSSTEFVKEA